MNPPDYILIKELIENGNLYEALNEFAKLDLSGIKSTEVSKLKNRYSRIKKEQLNGIIEDDDYRLEYNRITHSLLLLMENDGPIKNIVKTIFESYKKSTNVLSKAFSPAVVLIELFAGFENIMEFITEYHIFSIVVLVILFVVFGYHLLSIITHSRRNKQSTIGKEVKKKTIETSIVDDDKSMDWNAGALKTFFAKYNKLFTYLGIGTLIASFFIVLYIFFLGVTGYYIPIVETLPQKGIKKEMVRINNELKERGETLRLSFYCNSAKQCAISPNGVHFSKEEAQESIDLARKLIPKHVDDKSWIQYKTFKATIVDRWRALKKHFN